MVVRMKCLVTYYMVLYISGF